MEDRAHVWKELVNLWNEFKLPFLITGDFDEVLSPLNIDSQKISTNESLKFQSFLQDTQLIEIPLSYRGLHGIMAPPRAS